MTEIFGANSVRFCFAVAVSALTTAAMQGQVLMNVSTQPSAGVAGVTTVNAIGSRFPLGHGLFSAATVTLSLSTSCGGPAVATVAAKSITTVLGSQLRISFALPSSIVAGTYFVALAGATGDGTAFGSAAGSCSEVAVTHVNTAQMGCVASGTLSVLAPPQGGIVRAYAANGCWECSGDQYKGVRVVNIEGPSGTSSIATPDVVNSCATNSVTGETVCAANGKDVYLIQDASLITTLQSGSSAPSTITGGPNNFGVVMNPLANEAVLGVGLDRGRTGVNTGLQVLNLGTNVFSTPIPSKQRVSDEIVLDPGRGLLLSPNGAGNYDLFSMTPDGSGIEFSNQLGANEDWDSAAEDCSTGIALAPSESTSGDIYITDLTQLHFDTDKGTWTAPGQLLPLKLGVETIAVAPGDSHLGIMGTEYTNGGPFTVIQLPSTSGAGTPTILDYVQGNIPGFLGTPDPHSITAYTSPNDGKAYGVIASSFPATDIARIDLACVLAQPRAPNSHTLSAFAAPCIQIFATGNAGPAPPQIISAPHASTAASLVYEDKILVSAANNFPLSFRLSSAPTGLSIDPATGLLHWVPSTAQVGLQDFTVTVTDVFGLTATKTFSVNVFVVQNSPPVITSTPSTRSTVGVLYAYQVQATDRNPASLRYSLSAAPVGMSIDPVTGLVQWIPSTGLSNQTANVTVQVINANFLYASQSFQVFLAPAANHPPVITSSPGTSATVGQTYTYQLRATDPDNDPLAFSLISAPLGMTLDPSAGLLQWTPASTDVGSLSISVRAKDPGALIGTQTFQLTVQRAYPVPTLAVSSPAPNSTLNKPADIVASISDPAPSGPPITWTIDLLRGDNTTQRIASGSGAVSNGVVGHLDPTLIRDDSYSIVITAGKLGQLDSKTFDYTVTSGNLKLGNFRTSFTDIAIPVAGIPLTITRTYNSLDVTNGEFGAGWRLALPGQVVDSARETPLEPFTANTRVYVTRPDGTREGFTFAPTQPSPLIPVFVPGFRADAGVTDTLSVDPADLANGNGAYFELLGGPYNPSTYKLTTKFGVEYTIDEVAGLEQIKDRNGNTLTITPDGIESSSGLSLPIEHDATGRITRITEPGGGYVQYAYDASGNLASSFDQMGHETKYSYENTQFPHYLTKITDPLGRPVTRNVYNADGRLVAQCDAGGDVSTLAGCTHFNPQVDLQLQTIVSALGSRTDLYLDDQGNVLTERHWLDQTTHNDTVRVYDANSNLLSTTDPAGNVIKATWDASGNMLSQTDSGGNTTKYTYSSCNQPASVIDALSHPTTYIYDAACNLRFVTDALGGVTEYRYDSHGEVTDLLDQINNHWSWVYTSFGKPAQFTDPSGNSTQYGYYPNGDTRYKVDRNNRRSDYRYNSAHQLTMETWDTTPLHVMSYAYDDAGELSSASDADSSLAFTYTLDGRLQRADTAYTAGPAAWLKYTYDADGNLIAVQDSQNATTTYIYDPLSRTIGVMQSGAGVAPKRVDYNYDQSNILVSQRNYSDLAGASVVDTTTFRYQCGGCGSALIQSTTRAEEGSIIEDLNLSRDAIGNITAATDRDGDHAYSYDARSELLTADHSDPALQPHEMYRYDLAENRLASHLSSFYNYDYGDKTRLLEDSGTVFEYDGEGNVIAALSKLDSSRTVYTYDHRNRLVQVDVYLSNGKIFHSEMFSYDCQNRRFKWASQNEATFTIYDGLNASYTLNASATLRTRYLYRPGVDVVLADESQGTTRWYVLDQIGSTRDLVSNDGTQIAHYSYDSFGQLLGGNQEGLPLFTGRQLDVSGVSDLRARQYDPRLGRFIQSDELQPLGYSYVGNNPLRNKDPFGLANTAEEVNIYRISVDGEVRYVGISNDVERRLGQHAISARFKAIGFENVEAEELVAKLSRLDARALEQYLLEGHGFGSESSSLLNIINSVGPDTPYYPEAILRGWALAGDLFGITF